ncbi:hypothetical protein HF325_003564 [Metschnikowia pulcherrima]|uniref:Cytochrome P450 n=1 Tax=Metschnikowia pulcherrima TaxID=27326 RepID=A0A8H7GU61_9ASCO|nr:hypothetical protein HF325_003564 [Metschnikowia pulcherrima]
MATIQLLMDTLGPYVLKWYTLLIVLGAFYYLHRSYIEFKFNKAFGCKRAYPMDIGFLGISSLVELLDCMRKGTALEYLGAKTTPTGRNTFEIYLAGVKILFTKDPEIIKAVLATQFNDFALGSRHAHFLPLLGDGIFTLDGDGWKNSRAMLRPQFSREEISHVKILEPHLQTLASHIRKSHGDVFDIQDLFFKFTVDTATDVLFGESVYCLRDGTISELPPADGFQGREAKTTKNPRVLQDQLLNIMVAGRDTTAGLLSFTMFELSRHPQVWGRLKEEVYARFGKGTAEDIDKITFESLKKCEYLKWILNEALRLYPSVPVNFRDATKDTTLPVGGGKDEKSPLFVPKGTTVAYTVYYTHRLKEVYGEDAEEFKPERWASQPKLGWSYVPFNGGPRICLGQQFALTEASYTIVRLLQLFPNLTSAYSGPYPPKKMLHLTLSMFDGVPITMTEEQ